MPRYISQYGKRRKSTEYWHASPLEVAQAIVSKFEKAPEPPAVRKNVKKVCKRIVITSAVIREELDVLVILTDIYPVLETLEALKLLTSVRDQWKCLLHYTMTTSQYRRLKNMLAPRKK